ncbi:transposase [Rhizobium sp. CF142]|nr:transposase [Rhizobium sp. CF142]
MRLWAEKFDRHFAGEIRRRSAGRPGDKWYLDEVVTTIGGKKNWLWWAVDQDGFVLDVPVQIASIGLRYTNFHTTSLCSRTRAALITGRNHHSVGFGVISEASTGYPGYDSVITVDKDTQTIFPDGNSAYLHSSLICLNASIELKIILTVFDERISLQERYYAESKAR